MVLQKTVIPTNLAKGIDTKTSQYQTTGYLQLNNCFQEKTGSVQKRFGLTSLSNSVYNNTPISNIITGTNLFTFNDELLMHNSSSLYAYNDATMNWIYVNDLYTNTLSATPVVVDSYSQTIPSVAYKALSTTSGVELHAWEDSRGGVYVTIIESITGNIIYPVTLIDSTYSRPKVVTCGPNLFLVAVKGTTSLVSRSINAINPTTFSSENLITASLHTTLPCYDVIPFNNAIVFAYNNTSSQLNVGYLTVNNVVGSPVTGYPNPVVFASITFTNAIGICSDPSFMNIFIGYCGGAGIRHIGLNASLGVIYADTSIDASKTSTQLTVAYQNNLIYFIYQVTGSPTVTSACYTNTLTLATNTAGTPSTFFVGAGLLSKIFLSRNTLFVGLVYDTNLQSTYFLVRATDAFIVSKFAYAQGGGLLPKSNSLANFIDVNGVISFDAATRVNISKTSASTVSFVTGIYKYTFDFVTSSFIQSEQLGGNLHIAGGYIQAYDGISTVELGYLLAPELPTFTTGSGALSGVYQYEVVWEWLDQEGQLHQSEPSPIMTTGNLSSNNVTLTIKTLNFTFKQPKYNRTNVMAVIYRTLSNGTVFFRLTTVTSPLYNDPTINYITYVDNAADSTISGNKLLYTTGGVQSNFVAPAASIMHAFQNRLWLVEAEYPVALYYSKEFVSEEGIAFTDQGQILVNETGGKITAIIDLDDKLVIFKNSSTYVTTGNGPDDTGQNGSFAIPQIISGEIGCINVACVAKIPNGVMFLSSKGIYLLNRSLSFEYIGAPVEAYNSLTFTGSTIIPDFNQARFVTAEGTTLVYDWFFTQWYTFTNQAAVASIIWSNKFLVLSSAGIVRQEIENTYSDDGKTIQQSILTPWYSFAGIQGYQRLYSMLILGKYEGGHTLTVTSSYDFESSPSEIVSIDTQALLNGSIWGSGAIWGTNPPWGGLAGGTSAYQFEYKPARQKCESVQFLIQDNFPTNLATAGFQLHAMTFTVGVKTGQQKTPAVRRLT